VEIECDEKIDLTPSPFPKRKGSEIGGLMARPKDKVRSVRVRLDGYLKPGTDPEVDRVLMWLASLPPRTKFPAVIARLIVGGVVEAMIVDDEAMIREQVQAAKDIMANFVVE